MNNSFHERGRLEYLQCYFILLEDLHGGFLVHVEEATYFPGGPLWQATKQLLALKSPAKK